MRDIAPPPIFEDPEVRNEGIVFDKLPGNGVLMVRRNAPTIADNEACQAEVDAVEWVEEVTAGKDYSMNEGVEFYIEFNPATAGSPMPALSSYFPMVGQALSTFAPIVGQGPPAVGDILNSSVDYHISSAVQGTGKRDIR